VIAGPVSLVQGGIGIIIRRPIFVADPAGGGGTRYWGLVSTVIDFPKLIARSHLSSTADSLRLAMRGTGGQGAMGGIFWGDKRVFGDAPVLSDITLPSGTWRLGGVPAKGWPGFHPFASSYFQAGGLASLSLAGLLFGLLLTRSARRLEIVQRTQAETALRDSETRLLTAQEVAHLGFLDWNLETNKIAYSDEAYRLFGISRDDAPATPDQLIAKVVYPDDRALVLKRLTEAVQGLSRFEFDHRILRPDGTVLWITTYAELVRDADGNPVRLLIAAHDISERIAAETELIKAEARFRALIENATDLVAVVSEDSTITYASPSVQTALGWDSDELVGRLLSDLVPEEAVDELGAGIRALVKSPGQAMDVSYRLRHKDGSWRQLEGTARSLLDNPSVRGIIVNARDATERNRLEEQLRITERLEALGRLAGGVAHDLNNLLTVIAGSASFLSEGLPEGSPLQDDVAQIEIASGRANALIAQLLAFGRRKPGTPRSLDLNSVIGDFEPILRKLLGEGVVLATRLDPTLESAKADQVQLEQVIVNLIVNARDATSRKGTVTLETGNLVASEHEPFLMLKPGSYVWLSVSDDGVGMTQEVRERIFEPFFSTKGSDGTGLGLASAYGIVTHGGGTITAESEPGKGARFRVFLPSGR
jgi:PAS domain S-box-containing protein